MRNLVEGLSERLLIGATGLPLERIVDEIHALGGLAVAAHIDRESFGILGQLGFIPEGLPLDALEVTRRLGLAGARRRYPELARFAFIESSDSHIITDIGAGVTRVLMAAPLLSELKLALEKKDGRSILE